MVEMFYQPKIVCLKLVSYLGLNPKLTMRYSIKVGIWRIVKWKEENLSDPSRSSNNFQIKSLTSSVQITQLFMNIMMYKEQRLTIQSKKM